MGLTCCTGPATLHCPLDTSPAFPQVPAAGIEANIPVTYAIGSQRGDKSTGCQFIGQSPVHSVSAACWPPTALGHPGPGGAATESLLACWAQPPLCLHGDGPPPQITAAPLEGVGTSTWSCCYRGWEPLEAALLGLRSGEGPAAMTWAPGSSGPWVHGLFIEAPYRVGPTPSLGEVQAQPQICPQSREWPRLPLRRSLCPPDTHTLCPQVPCFLVSFPTRAGPQFQFGCCASLLCPLPTLPAAATGQRARDAWACRPQGPPNARFRRRWPCRKETDTGTGG